MTQIFNQFRNQLVNFVLITNQFENKFLLEKFIVDVYYTSTINKTRKEENNEFNKKKRAASKEAKKI